MKFIIVAATYTEIAPLFEHLKLENKAFSETPLFDILITGVGMTATALALGKHLNVNYSYILNVGIAGSFKQEFKIGDVVTVVEDTFSELGAEDNDKFISLEEMGLGKVTYKALGIPELKNVKSLTLNKVHGSKNSIKEIVERLNPDIESMEGAAVFYCAEQCAIPTFQVRSISNYIEPRDRSKWDIPLAVQKLNEWLIKHIQK